MSLREVQAFFQTYQEAFNRLDGDAVADLWHSQSGIADSRDGHGRVTWWADDATMRANQIALCAIYRGNGYDHAEFDIEAHQALGANHAFARLHWTLWRADGSLLQGFQTGYNLIRTAQGPKVLLATAYEEDLQTMKRHAAH